MSFTGKFNRILSKKSGVMIHSFSLTCSNWLQSETIDFMLSDAQTTQPWYYRQQTIKAGGVLVFNYDNCGWQWCQGDYFAILNPNGSIGQGWQLNLKEYAPGECPECHGTHKCAHCKGQGIWADLRYGTGIQTCQYCGGTGICGTCNIPRRNIHVMPQNTSYDSNIANRSSNSSPRKRHRPIADIKSDIQFAQSQLERAEWNYRYNKMNGLYDNNQYILQQSEIFLLSSYRQRLIALQEELRQATS